MALRPEILLSTGLRGQKNGMLKEDFYAKIGRMIGQDEMQKSAAGYRNPHLPARTSVNFYDCYSSPATTRC